MARIVFTLEDGTEIETELDADVITIGRHPDSIVVLPSASVSSHHATIKRRGDSHYVQDLGTTNGTKLNGVEVEEAKLEDGDTLTFGDIPGVVHLTDKPVHSKPVKADHDDDDDAPVALTAPRTGAAVRRPPQTLRARPVTQYKESTGCAGFLIFMIFLVIAFIVGLHIRHAVEMGGGNVLFIDVVKKMRDSAVERAEHEAAKE